MKQEKFTKDIEERVKHVVLNMLKGNAFTERKLTDTPTDNLSVVNRAFVTKNGTIANRPSSVVAVIGQPYFATDINYSVTWNGTNWVSQGSIIASA